MLSPPKGVSPLKSAIEESNLKYLGQFNDSSLNQLLNVLSSSPHLPSIVGLSKNALDGGMAAPMGGPSSRLNQQVIGKKRFFSERRAPGSREDLALTAPSRYDIDLTLSASCPQPKALKTHSALKLSSAKVTEIAPLSYLLSRPSIANTSTPLPCPFAHIASVAVREEAPPPSPPVPAPALAPVSASPLCNGIMHRTEKSLQYLCRRFLDKCRQAAGDAEVLVSVHETAEFLQVQQRRVHDIFNVLAAIGVLLASGGRQSRAKSQLVYRDPALIEDHLAEIQNNAILRYPARAAVAGLLAHGCREPQFETRGSRVSSAQESLCVALVGLFLAGLDEISLQEASVHLPPALSEEDPAKPANTADSTKMKRLYDVANTLCGAGLLCKIELTRRADESVLKVFVYKWAYFKSVQEIRRTYTERSGAAACTENIPLQVDTPSLDCSLLFSSGDVEEIEVHFTCAAGVSSPLQDHTSPCSSRCDSDNTCS